MTKVLVVDDEPSLVVSMRVNLSARGYDVVTAKDGRSALDAAAKARPDVVLLDLGLPDLDGVTVIQGLRGWTTVPVIVLSARHGSAEKVRALDAGADDYVTKPFGMDELLARLRASVRRSATVRQDEEPVVDAGGFVVDLSAGRVERDGVQVRLTPTEWHLLEVLARDAGKLVSQRRLLQEVWGPAYGKETQYLRVYMAQLRRKLEADPGHPEHLITEPGIGYRLVVPSG
jgi:two-component system KDP operon response regulator KdpE